MKISSPRLGERAAEGRWLFLVHQLPKKAAYPRVKIWRRLHDAGAVAVKHSVYALPRTEQAMEDFHWIVREIEAHGGEAMVCEARPVHGMTDQGIEALFATARDAEYDAVAREIRKAIGRTARGISQKRRPTLEAESRRLQRRFDEITRVDFFDASGQEAVRGLLGDLSARIERSATPAKREKVSLPALKGRTWVTRQGIHVDRIASAWLIRRFVDPDARLKFVVGKGYLPEPGELRFDMFEAEFTHVGDRCTFEVLLGRLELDDRALGPIGEIVHDIDLHDGKFAREQVVGVETMITAIASSSRSDEERLTRGAAVFDNLYEFFRRG